MAPDSPLKRLAQMSKPGNWIIAAIEGAQYSVGTGRNDPGYFHPSAFGHDCDAHLAFRYLGAPAVETIEAKTRRIFDYGEHREGYLHQYAVQAGISLIKSPKDRLIELPLWHIRGELDEWVENPVTKEQFIIDYKTMRSELWKALETAVPAHRLQVQPYQYAKQVQKAFVLYENKDTQELKAMEANFDGKLWKTEITDRIERILSGLEKDLVYRNPVNCSRCPFFPNGICAANQIAKLKEASELY